MANIAKDGAKASQKKGSKKKGAPKAGKEAAVGAAAEDAPKAAVPKKAETSKRVFNPEHCARTMMVFGCSPKVGEAAYRAKWPDMVSVYIPPRTRQRIGPSAVLFKTSAEAEAAAKVGMTEIAGERARVEMQETPEQREKRMEQRQRSVILSSLPAGSTEKDVRAAFPSAETVLVHVNKKGETNGWATVTVRTKEEAAAAAGRAVEVMGASIVPFVPGQRPPAPEASKKRKAAEPSPAAPTPTAGTTEPQGSKPAKKKPKKAAH